MSFDPQKEYIGDGVHAESDGYHVILTVPGSSHSSGADQRIGLEPKVLSRLDQYRLGLRKRIERERVKAETGGPA